MAGAPTGFRGLDYREHEQEVGTDNNGGGYGYLWWTRAPIAPGGSLPEVDRRAMYYGSGTGGQLVLVVPADDLVIVHRGDTDHNRPIAGRDVWRIVEQILASRTGTAAPTAPTMPLTPVPFASQLPLLVPPDYLAIDELQLAALVGRYEIVPNLFVRVFAHAGRLFADFPGRGEAELFATAPLAFTVRVMHGVRIEFVRGPQGEVTGFAAEIGPDRVRGVKRGG